MKNYVWAKGYKYVDVPIYLIRFWKIRLFKIGSKKRRIGTKLTNNKTWKLYGKMITDFYDKP